MSRESEIVDLFMRCKHPVRQIETIAELCGTDIKTVIRVLKKAKKIPYHTTIRNYKERLAEFETVELTSELADHVRALHEEGCTKKTIMRKTGLLMKQIDRALGARI